jgi:hypothetical protein
MLMRAKLFISVFVLAASSSMFGCSYTIDKGLACENEPYAEGGYGEDCTNGGCGNNTEAKVCFDEKYLGLGDLVDTGEILDGGAAGGGADIISQVVGMVEPMMDRCTRGQVCETEGCALCYQCCDCKFKIGDIVTLSGRYTPANDLLDEEILFTACLPSEMAEQLSLLCACPPNAAGGPPTSITQE